MELVDGFENGDIELKVYHLSDGSIKYWLRAGVALLELDEDRFVSLVELLQAYVEEGRLDED